MVLRTDSCQIIISWEDVCATKGLGWCELDTFEIKAVSGTIRKQNPYKVTRKSNNNWLYLLNIVQHPWFRYPCFRVPHYAAISKHQYPNTFPCKQTASPSPFGKVQNSWFSSTKTRKSRVINTVRWSTPPQASFTEISYPSFIPRASINSNFFLVQQFPPFNSVDTKGS